MIPIDQNKTIYDPFPEKPGHEAWEQVCYTAAHTMDSEIFKVFTALRGLGVCVEKGMKGILKVYNIKRGDIPAERFKDEIIPGYLEPNREKIKAVLSLAAFEGEVTEYPGIFCEDPEVARQAGKKYRAEIIGAMYRREVVGRVLGDGRRILVVPQREAGADETEITWEEFYILCYMQDVGLLDDGPEGISKGVRWREV